jgi:uncharacterized protein
VRQWQDRVLRISPLVEEAREAILQRLDVQPYLLILYGSEARGEATPESDIDLLVVLDDLDSRIEDEIRDAVYGVMWNDDFSRLISIQVVSRREFEDQRRKGYSFARNVEEDGIVFIRS